MFMIKVMSYARYGVWNHKQLDHHLVQTKQMKQ